MPNLIKKSWTALLKTLKDILQIRLASKLLVKYVSLVFMVFMPNLKLKSWTNSNEQAASGLGFWKALEKTLYTILYNIYHYQLQETKSQP